MPGLRRFAQRDPLAHWPFPGTGYHDSLNLYQLARMMPIDVVDPSGIAARRSATSPTRSPSSFAMFAYRNDSCGKIKCTCNQTYFPDAADSYTISLSLGRWSHAWTFLGRWRIYMCTDNCCTLRFSDQYTCDYDGTLKIGWVLNHECTHICQAAHYGWLSYHMSWIRDYLRCGGEVMPCHELETEASDSATWGGYELILDDECLMDY